MAAFRVKLTPMLLACSATLLWGCASYGSYSEMVERKKIETDPEVIAQLNKRIDRFEKDADDMAQYNDIKRQCLASYACIWFCKRRGPRIRQLDGSGTDISLEERVRQYRRDRTECGPMSKADLNDMLRRL